MPVIKIGRQGALWLLLHTPAIRQTLEVRLLQRAGEAPIVMEVRLELTIFPLCRWRTIRCVWCAWRAGWRESIVDLSLKPPSLAGSAPAAACGARGGQAGGEAARPGQAPQGDDGGRVLRHRWVAAILLHRPPLVARVDRAGSTGWLPPHCTGLVARVEGDGLGGDGLGPGAPMGGSP